MTIKKSDVGSKGNNAQKQVNMDLTQKDLLQEEFLETSSHPDNEYEIIDWDHELLTVNQVAQILSLSTRTIYRLINSKELSGIKLAKEWRIPKHIVEDYVQSRSGNITLEKSRKATTNTRTSRPSTRPRENRKATTAARSSRVPSTAPRMTSTTSRFISTSNLSENQDRVKDHKSNKYNVYFDQVQDINDAFVAFVELKDHSEIIIEALPLKISEDTDGIVITEDNVTNSPKLRIKKIDAKIRALYRVAEGDNQINDVVKANFNILKSEFDWNQIIDSRAWDDVQRLVIRFMQELYLYGRGSTDTNNTHDVLKLISLMDNDWKIICMDALSVFLGIEN